MSTALKMPPRYGGDGISRRRLTIDEIEYIEAALVAGTPPSEIAKLMGVGAWTVNLIAQQKHWLQRQRVEKAATPSKRKASFEPTPDEIATACEAIRQARNEENLAAVRAADRMGYCWSASEGGAV